MSLKGKMMHKSHSDKPVLNPLSHMEDFKRPPKTIRWLDGHEQNWIDDCKGGTRLRSPLSIENAYEVSAIPEIDAYSSVL